MAADMSDDRAMISEKIAPTLVSRVLNSFDLVVIFVALVLFISNSSTVQFAGSAIYVFWVLGFLTFLIPGALVTAQLGRMFPEEGSLYVWTQKALGPFWGFFAGFVAWWPGVLVMVLTGSLVVTLSQAINSSLFSHPWPHPDRGLRYRLAGQGAPLGQLVRLPLVRPEGVGPVDVLLDRYSRPPRHRGAPEHGRRDQEREVD